ncbi:MAG: hypothetical protein ACI4F0_07935 [Agathobacter sp.]
MKELFTEYGDMVIAVFTACVLIPFFVGIRFPLSFQSAKNSTEAFHSYASEGKVDMEYLNVPMTEQKREVVDDHFLATLGDSGKVQFQICVVLDEEGNRLYSTVWEGKEELLFGKPGIYTVYFRTVDEIGRTQYGKLKIPVQRKFV